MELEDTVSTDNWAAFEAANLLRPPDTSHFSLSPAKPTFFSEQLHNRNGVLGTQNGPLNEQNLTDHLCLLQVSPSF